MLDKKYSAITITMLLMLTSILVLEMVSAVDGDGDGLDDSLEDCPFAAGNSTQTWVGCPDSDGNGQADFDGASTDDWDEAGREVYDNVGGGGGSSTARAVAWAPDGIHFAGGGRANYVRLYSSDGSILSTLFTMSVDVRDLAFSPNGSYLAVTGYFDSSAASGRAYILEMNWASNSATVLSDLSSFHSGDVYATTWSNDGSTLYTGGEDMKIRLFNTTSWSIVRTLDMPDMVYNLKATPDNRLIGSVHGEESSMNWTSNGTNYFNYHNHSTTALGLAISPDGRWMVSAGDDAKMYVYNISSKATETVIYNGLTDVNEIDFDSTGGFFVIGTDGSSASIYRTSDWGLEDSFASLGSGNSRGARDVAWSPDGLKIAFAQRNGRVSMYILPAGYIELRGDITGEIMLGRWKANVPSDGRPMSHENVTSLQVSQDLCNGHDSIGVGTVGPLRHISVPLSNHTNSGLSNCSVTGREILEIPIGRMPATFFVQTGGQAEACLSRIGGLSMGQLRWILSGGSYSTFTSSGWAPAMNISSIAPNDDFDGIQEWSDLDSSCPSSGVHVYNRWDNRSIPTAMERLFTCAGCEYPENFFISSNDRYRISNIETRSGVMNAIANNDLIIGFTEMRVTANYTGITAIPIADNWTNGVVDHILSGGIAVHPSYDNSSNGSYAAQADYTMFLDSSRQNEYIHFLNWLLEDGGQDQWHDIGFVRLGILARVQAWKRIGLDMEHLLPDEDNDGVWDGDDNCLGTWPSEYVDEYGCAQHQIDNDGDGYFNHEDDCVNTSGVSLWPDLGCPDQDGDGWMDSSDAFPSESSQWEDGDSDGYGDNLSGFEADACPEDAGVSHLDRIGCIDTDLDGWSDEDGDWTINDGADEFPLDFRQWIDNDADGYGDNYSFTLDSDGLRNPQFGDAFILDPSQWSDRDGDGFGDNPQGSAADDCPDEAGTSEEDSLGCLDSDGDGWSDLVDEFPEEITQWEDTDGDGYGDNWAGNEPDQCIETPTFELPYIDENGCGPSERDNDSDGVMDDIDLCPNTAIEDAAQVGMNGCADSESDDDGDGIFNPVDGPDGVFKNDPTQSADSDGDGYGDNSTGLNGDACPSVHGSSSQDRLGCPDNDEDGYSDPGQGWNVDSGADAWVNEPTQWADSDGDGYYDNYDNPAWTASREDGWPGKYISGARLGDKCPLNASDSAYPDPGCPATEINIIDYGNSGSTDSGFPLGLILILLLVVASIGGLTAAVVVKSRGSKKGNTRKQSKPQKGQSRKEEVLGNDIYVGGDDTIVSQNDSPHWEIEGVIGDDDYEWLEWPEGSGMWWYRNDSGYWSEWE